jgi:hypothetical protein
MQNFVSKKLCWFMIFILIFMWSGIFEYKAFAQQRTEPSTEELKKVTDKLERLFDALEAALEELPRDTFDPNAIIQKVGNDPIKLFEWVRDNTYFVPYHGVLRGSTGVLMDGLGNSLDRALLLHVLLHIAGKEVRLACGTLTEEQTQEMLFETQIKPVRSQHEKNKFFYKDVDYLVEKYSKKYDLDKTQLRKIIEDVYLNQKNTVENISKRVEEQTPIIAASIYKFREKGTPENKKANYKALKNHWWVQWKKDSFWQDLDPTLPTAKPGQTLTKIQETCDPDRIEQDLLHLVDIRVIVERLEEGNFKEEVVFEHTLRPSELFGKQIVLQHCPLNWPNDLNFFKEDNPLQSLQMAVIKQVEWIPILTVGSEKFSKFSFTDSGMINESPGPKSGRTGVRGITRGILGPLSGGEKKSKESQLTAEWIEYALNVPGNQIQTIRRDVFDLIGPGARMRGEVPKLEITESMRLKRSLSILRETEILTQVCHLSQDFVTYLKVKNLLSNRELFLNILSEGDFSLCNCNTLVNQANKITPLPGPEYDLAFVRREINQKNTEIYLDSPNIIAYYKGISYSKTDGLMGYHGFDIVNNKVATRLHADADSFKAQIKQGVLDTNAEALLLNGFAKTVKNTGEIFARANELGIEWIAIHDLNDPILDRLKLSDDVCAHINHDLSGGYIVLVPQKTISIRGKEHIGWWRINPRTGHTLGIGENHTGQAMTDWMILTINAVVTIWCVIGAYNSDSSIIAYASCTIGFIFGMVGGAAGTLPTGSTDPMALFFLIFLAAMFSGAGSSGLL